ncbi:hypothetical protein CPB85DRAFT_1299839 [Mucidula mucida]|nr:hypothetical protein CPB85DRAFT_1299839 [Mucidula mucida]
MKYAREVKNALWRKPGEKSAELPDIEALLRHAGLGGLCSAVLGSSLRALVNLLLLLIRRKKPHFALIFSRDQLLMRGVQGFLSTRGIHPDPILLFSLACAQIMYANLRAPHSLPPAYRSYVVKGARVPPEAIKMSYTALEQERKWECTAENRTLLSSWKEGPIPLPPPRLVDGAKFMLPIYAALHILPTVLLRPATFFKHPTRVPLGIARSCAFFGLYVYVNQIGICLRSAGAPIGYWFPGLASGIALGVEAPRRRLELALYVLPKAVESAWICLGLPRTWVGEVIMTAVGAGLVMQTYQEQPKHLVGAVRAVMYQLVGNN